MSTVAISIFWAILTVSPPFVNVPANIVTTNVPGVTNAVVNFTLPPETNSAGLSNVVATPASGSAFPLGTTVVTVVLTDIYGNMATNTFTVTVTEAVSIVPASGGSLTISWTQGVLLQSTNLAGPWTTNTTAVPPFTVLPTNSSMYFKVQVN